MNTLTIVDTDILIDAGQAVREAIECLADIEQQSALAISVITQLELWVGCRNKTEQRHIERFLHRFHAGYAHTHRFDERVRQRQPRLPH